MINTEWKGKNKLSLVKKKQPYKKAEMMKI